MSDLLVGTITAVVSGLLGAIFGGLTSYFVSKKSSERNELINRVAKIEQNLEQLSELSAEYWQYALDDIEAKKYESNIKKLRRKCGREITRLKGKNPISKNCDILFSSFLKAVNGTDHVVGSYFEKRPHSADPHRIEQINNLHDDLITEVRVCLNIT